MKNTSLDKLNDIANSSDVISKQIIASNKYTTKITLYLHKHDGTIKVRNATIYGTTDRVQKIDRKITFKSDGAYVRFQWDTLRQAVSLNVHEI